jgi:hypothetical protein
VHSFCLELMPDFGVNTFPIPSQISRIKKEVVKPFPFRRPLLNFSEME